MLVLVKAFKENPDCYVQELDKYYLTPYATVAVNPSMPTKKIYVNFESSSLRRAKLVASDGTQEITINHEENELIIRSHREYRCSVNYCDDMPAPKMFLEDYQSFPVHDTLDDHLYNVEALARWIREHKALIRLGRVLVHVDSENRLVTISLNNYCKLFINEDAVLD